MYSKTEVDTLPQRFGHVQSDSIVTKLYGLRNTSMYALLKYNYISIKSIFFSKTLN